MDAALAHLARAGFTKAILWVLEDNPIGRSFHERYGWVSTTATKTETFGDNEVTERQYRINLTTPALGRLRDTDS